MRASERIALAILGLLFVLRCVATLHPSAWMWGFDSLADRSPALRVVGLALFAIAILQPVGIGIVRGLLRIGRVSPGRWIFAAGCAVALVVLWILRSRNLMLGDAQTYVSTIEKGMRAAGGAHREPLAQGIVTGFHAVLGGTLGLGGQGSFTAVEMILAAGALAIGVLLARRITPQPEGRIVVFAAILLGGGLQLYSGYPEFYGFAVAAILLFALLGLRWIDEGGSLIPVALAFAIAGLMHAQSLFTAPALAFLILLRWKSGGKRDATIATAVVPAAAALGLALLHYPFREIGHEASRTDSFLPPIGVQMTRTAYGVFAPAHAAELLNVLLLIAPTFPALIALAAGGRRGRVSEPPAGSSGETNSASRGGEWAGQGVAGASSRRSSAQSSRCSLLRPSLRSSLQSPPQSRARRDVFLALLAIGPILFAFLANPQLGMVRDWDIFALPVTVAALWIASMGVGAPAALRGDRTRAMRGGRPPANVGDGGAATRGTAAPANVGDGRRAIAGAILATSLLHSLFWIDSNHAPDPSRERIRRVATEASFFGPQSLGEVWRYIGSADATGGDLERASASYLAAIAADPDDRMSYRMLAGIEITRAADQGKGIDEGLATYHSLLAGSGEGREGSGRGRAAGGGDRGDAGGAGGRGAGRARSAYAFYGGAIAAVTSKREDLALREAKEMIAAEPDHPELISFWGDLVRRAGRPDEARAAYEAALSRDPSQPRARIGLACLAGAAGDAAACEAEAREALRRTPWSPQAQQFARLIAQSKGSLSADSFRRYLFIQ